MAQGCGINARRQAGLRWAFRWMVRASCRVLVSAPGYRRTVGVGCLLALLSSTAWASAPNADAFDRGVAAYQRGDWQQADAEFSAYLAQLPFAPFHREVRFYLAEVQVQRGAFAKARRNYSDYLRQPADDFPAFAVRAQFRLGEVSFHLKDYDRAADQLHEFVRQHGEDPLVPRAADYLAEIAEIQTRQTESIRPAASLAETNTDGAPTSLHPSAPDRRASHVRLSTAAEHANPPRRPLAISLDDIRSAAGRGESRLAIALAEALLEARDIPQSARSEAARIACQMRIELGNEHDASRRYSAFLSAEDYSLTSELDLRRDAAAALTAHGYRRAASRELARCQVLQQVIDAQFARRTKAPDQRQEQL